MRASTHIAWWGKTGDPNSTAMSSVPNTPPTLPPDAPPPWRPSSPTHVRRATWRRRRRRQICPAGQTVPIVLPLLHFRHTSSSTRRASMVILAHKSQKLIYKIFIFAQFSKLKLVQLICSVKHFN